MKSLGTWLFRRYAAVVIDHPLVSVSLVLLVVLFFGVHAPNFKLDASPDSLVLENDEALKYYRMVRDLYGSDDFLVVTYTPHDELLSASSLAGLRALRDDLSQVKRVESVTSVLDVPLLYSPKIALTDLAEGVRTLETPGVDLRLAMKEFLESPIYRNNLVSPDGRTTALQVLFERDDKYFALLNVRDDLREKELESGLTAEESRRLKEASRAFKQYLATVIESDRARIATVRGIMDRHRQNADMFLGGASMITSDMISYIEHDLVVFGIGVSCFLVLALVYFFRRLRWVLLPMACCVLTIVFMVGFLGYLDWRVTVISSNFISLLLINTMSLTIHLIVRYRILAAADPAADQRTLVSETVRIVAEPAFYTAVTTIVAFASLVVSDIRPVIDFGWMMTIGIGAAFVLNFTFFPSALALLPRERVGPERDATKAFTLAVATFTQRHIGKIIGASTVIATLALLGIPQLEVENRFIDHFKSTTEIYQGMELVDTQLGGTIPLDVIITADQEFYELIEEVETSDDSMDDPFAEEDETSGMTYWFNTDMLERAQRVHDYLEGLPEVGKVLSIATGFKVFRDLQDGQVPDDYDLAVVRKAMPDDVNDALIAPYLSPDGNEARFNMRLVESAPELKRQELIDKINLHLVEQLKFDQENVHFSGLGVLYNNLLQSLYRSQILTLGFVFVAIFIMFLLLFRSVAWAILAIIPNLLAAGLVLGLMGWVGIPLDVMTITIAAIVIGIAVDDAIHYVHRFRTEYPKLGDYLATMRVCHGGVGRAMYYTSITITVGFSILALSSFIPTIYFGVLVGFAMIAALMGNLSLLPALIMMVKPCGPSRQAPESS